MFLRLSSPAALVHHLLKDVLSKVIGLYNKLNSKTESAVVLAYLNVLLKDLIKNVWATYAPFGNFST